MGLTNRKSIGGRVIFVCFVVDGLLLGKPRERADFMDGFFQEAQRRTDVS